MNSYIALIRGINVGGQKKVLMADLRNVLVKNGLENVRTYIQSGNILFDYEGSLKEAESLITTAIKQRFKWEVSVLVITKGLLKDILKACPFRDEKMMNSYFTLLHEPPSKSFVTEVQECSTAEEEFYITQNCVYIFYTKGAGKSKFGTNWFEKRLQVSATSRNYRTLTKILELTK